MGADKAFLEIGGETFAQRAVKTLSEICPTVKVVLNRSQGNLAEKLRANVELVFDIYENRGAPGAIHAAFADCRTKYAVILAVDLPNVTGDIIKKLAGLIDNSNKITAIVPLQADDRLQPLCAVYETRQCLPQLEKLLETQPNTSVNDWLKLIKPLIIAPDKLFLTQEDDVFLNVNFPADLKILKKNYERAEFHRRP